jgi:putative PIN family toxin of toxin-antitoxin system
MKIVSSFFRGGNPRTVLERFIAGIDELFISKEIPYEINDVIKRKKFHVDEYEINYFINSIEEIANKIIPKDKINNGSRDKNDNKYIECVMAAHVDYIISGDIHLLELKEYEKIRIITAKDYLEIVK